MADPGTIRPGGRTAAVRAAVLAATHTLLAEAGLAGLDLAAVAQRAGVGKTTVYRRWGTPTGLVADALAGIAETAHPRSDTGSLPADLRANAEIVRDTLASHTHGPVFKAIIAAATYDAGIAQALAHFYDARVAVWAPCVSAAVIRGEAPPGTDAATAIRQVSAPLYYQFLTSRRQLTREDGTRAAAAALAAIQAGCFVS